MARTPTFDVGGSNWLSTVNLLSWLAHQGCVCRNRSSARADYFNTFHWPYVLHIYTLMNASSYEHILLLLWHRMHLDTVLNVISVPLEQLQPVEIFDRGEPRLVSFVTYSGLIDINSVFHFVRN